MNNQFRPLRFCRTIQWLLTYESRKLRNLFLVATAFFAWYDMFSLHYNLVEYSVDDPHVGLTIQFALEKVANISLLILVVFMCLGATFAFSTLFRRHAGRQLLLLPASNLEKFAALWLLYVPLLLVLLVLAVVAGDLLRMLILPLILEHGSQPSMLPVFFRWLGGWLLLNDSMQNVSFLITQTWVLILAVHAFSLLSGVLAGNVGWLLTAVSFYGVAYFCLGNYGQSAWHEPMLFVFAALFVWTAYWLFCRFPLIKSLFTLRFHGI